MPLPRRPSLLERVSRGSHLRATVVAALLAAGSLGGCSSASPKPPTPPAASDHAAPEDSATAATGAPQRRGSSAPAEPVLPAQISVQVGTVTLTIASATSPAAVDGQEDGSAVVTIAAAAGARAAAQAGSSTAGSITVKSISTGSNTPTDARFDVRPDGSVAVLDPAGAYVGALSRTRAVDGTGASRAVRFSAHTADPGRLDVVLPAPPDPDLRPATDGAGALAELTVTFAVGTEPLLSADWDVREGGLSLAVVPARWARAGGIAARDALWAAVVATEPEADTPSMLAQFGCHALGAPDKSSWNLEPWRPEVDSLTLLATRCNP